MSDDTPQPPFLCDGLDPDWLARIEPREPLPLGACLKMRRKMRRGRLVYRGTLDLAYFSRAEVIAICQSPIRC
jgi:hypothetical protein